MRYKASFCCISVIFAIILVVILGYILISKNQLFKSDKDPSDALYLTKYIEKGDIEVAQNLALVSHPDIPIRSYSGYFTVNKRWHSNLFFWFFPAKVNASEAPVVLWLQGGPGLSSLFGLFFENGPFMFDPNQTDKLIPREYSWHTNHNLIYIDQPVGSGFSFTKSNKGYANNQHDVGRDLLNALQQFFLLFPNLQRNEFFISGESYAGKFVPALGHAIHQDNKRQIDYLDGPSMPKINLKGLIIGNGITDPLHQMKYADYLYQLGLIDLNGHRRFRKYEKQQTDCILRRDFKCAHHVYNKMIHKRNGSLFRKITGLKSLFNYVLARRYKNKNENEKEIENKNENKRMFTFFNFLRKLETRRAIHVGNNKFQDLKIKDKVKKHMFLDVMDSVAGWMAELLSFYPVLLYTGQLDILVAYPMTENYIKYLKFDGADEFKRARRRIWRVDNEMAGYIKQGGNLTMVLVRDAGHFAPEDQPKWVFDIISRFTHHRGFR